MAAEPAESSGPAKGTKATKAPVSRKSTQTVRAAAASNTTANSAQAQTGLITNFKDILLKPFIENSGDHQAWTVTSNGENNITISTTTPAPFQADGSTLYHITLSPELTEASRPHSPQYGAVNQIRIPTSKHWKDPKTITQIQDTLRASFIGDPALYPRYQKHNSTKVTLEPYQEAACTAIDNAFTAGSDGVVEMPTGTGKSVVAMESLNRLIQHKKIDLSKEDVLFLVDSDAVLKDIEKHVAKLYPDLSKQLQRITAKATNGSKKEKAFWENHHFFISTPESLKNRLEDTIGYGKRFRYVMIDEVQDSQAHGFLELINSIKKASKDYKWNTRFTGYSATPFRHDDRKVLSQFDAGIIFKYSKREAWRQGYLPTMRIQKPQLNIPEDLTEEDRETIDLGSGHSIEFWRIRDTIQSTPSYNGKTFVSVTTTDQANRLNQYLKSCKIKSVALHSKNAACEAELQKWKEPNSEVDVAIVVDKFNVGADIRPGHMVCCRDIGSKTLLIQLLGRGLRPDRQKSELIVSDLANFSDNRGFVWMIMRYLKDRLEHRNSETKDYEYEDEVDTINHIEEFKQLLESQDTSNGLELECYKLDSNITAELKSTLKDIPSFLAAAHSSFNTIETSELQALDKYIANKLGLDKAQWAQELNSYLKDIAESIVNCADNQLGTLKQHKRELIKAFYNYENDTDYESYQDVNFRNRANSFVIKRIQRLMTDSVASNQAEKINQRMTYIFEELTSLKDKDRLKAAHNIKVLIKALFPNETNQTIIQTLLSSKYQAKNPRIQDTIQCMQDTYIKTRTHENLASFINETKTYRTFIRSDEIEALIYMLMTYASNQGQAYSQHIKPDIFAEPESEESTTLCISDFYQTASAFLEKALRMKLIQDFNTATALQQLGVILEKDSKLKDNLEDIKRRINNLITNLDQLNIPQLTALYKGRSETSGSLVKIQSIPGLAEEARRLEEAILENFTIKDIDQYSLRLNGDYRHKDKRFNIGPIVDKPIDTSNCLILSLKSDFNHNYISISPENIDSIEAQYQADKEGYLGVVENLIEELIYDINSDRRPLILIQPHSESHSESGFFNALQKRLSSRHLVFGPMSKQQKMTLAVSQMSNINLKGFRPLNSQGSRGIALLINEIQNYQIQKALNENFMAFKAKVTDSDQSTNVFQYISHRINILDDTSSSLGSTLGSDFYDMNTIKERISKFMQTAHGSITMHDLQAITLKLGTFNSKFDGLAREGITSKIIEAYMLAREGQAALAESTLKQIQDYFSKFTELCLVHKNGSLMMDFTHERWANGLQAREHQNKTNSAEAAQKKAILLELKKLEKAIELPQKTIEPSAAIDSSSNDLSTLAYSYNPLMGTLLWYSNAACKGLRHLTAATQSKSSKTITAHLSPNCTVYKDFKPKKYAPITHGKLESGSETSIKGFNGHDKIQPCECCFGDELSKLSIKDILDRLNAQAQDKPGAHITQVPDSAFNPRYIDN